jgi:transcriptional activator HAC1
MMLQRQLEQFTDSMTVFHGDNKSSSTAETGQFRQSSSPVTLSRDLFNSKDQEERPSVPQQCFADPHSIQTVNPASLSPEIRPVVESNAGSSDMTQHPAAMLCDLQCQSEEHRPRTASTSISQLLATILFFNLTSTLLSPLYQIINSLRTGSSLSPTTSVLTSIIWVVTTTASLSISTSMNSSTMTNQASPRPKFSLRIRLLNRLLACSPQLARPLMDATMAAMRLQSEQQFSRDGMTDAGALERCGDDSPSLEALMTLLWAIHIFEKKREGTPGPLPIESRELGELDGILRTRESGGLKGFPHLSLDQRTTGRKSLEGWRMVHDRA